MTIAVRKIKLPLVQVLLILMAFMFPYSVLSAEPNDLSESVFDMDIEELMNVEVSVASKKSELHYEAPGVIVAIPRSEFEIYGDRDLHQLLQRQPSVYTRDVFPYTDNVAGFRGDMTAVYDRHTLILMNGRPIRESAQGLNVNMYKTFPLSSLESVELIRGPGSVLYGSNAFTGVINLKPRIPDRNELAISSTAGSYGYYEADVTAGGRTGKLGYMTAFHVAGQQGYPYRMTDAFGVYGEDDRKYKSYSGTAHLNYGSFTFDGFWSDYDAFALGVVPSWLNSHQKFRNKKLFLNAGYRIPLHDRVSVELNLTYNLQENDLSSFYVFRTQMVGTNTSDILGEATLFANPIDNMNLVVGWLMEERTNYHTDTDKYQSIPSYRHEPKSFYAQGDYTFDRFLKLIAGTQWNKTSYGFDDWISRFGAIITPNDKWGVKLLRGEAFRGPVTLETDVYDPPVLVGNRNIEPETIITYDAQLFYHDNKTYGALTYFQSKIENIIYYDITAVPLPNSINRGVQRFEGIEFEGKYFFAPGWHILGSFMHQESEDDASSSPSVAPKHMTKVGMAYRWDEGTASVFCCFFGKPPATNFPSVPTLVVNPQPEAQNLINLNVDLDISRRLRLAKGQSTVTLRIENLLNEKIYLPTFVYYGSPNTFPNGPGTTFYAGITLKN